MLVTARGHAEAPVAAARDTVEPATTPAASTVMKARRDLEAALLISTSVRPRRLTGHRWKCPGWASTSRVLEQTRALRCGDCLCAGTGVQLAEDRGDVVIGRRRQLEAL
jgi:hypothetical protein